MYRKGLLFRSGMCKTLLPLYMLSCIKISCNGITYTKNNFTAYDGDISTCLVNQVWCLASLILPFIP